MPAVLGRGQMLRLMSDRKEMTRNPMKDNDGRSGRAENIGKAGRNNSLGQMQKP